MRSSSGISNTPGGADSTFVFGRAARRSYRSKKGDWDGDGDGTVGILRHDVGRVFLRNGNSNGPADLPVFTFRTCGAAGFHADHG
ncbi:MAG: hypothetical protein IPF53_09365 [Blastocatellia bacterium]|nr:hypothetical protein [Blastocatellia bacterium]